MKFRNILKRAMLGLALAGAVGFTATPQASAQAGAAGFAEMSVHDYLHRDIILFAQALNMDEGQRLIVESLYEDYRSEFDAGWARTQQRFTDMREDLQNVDRDQIMSMVLAPFENWQQEKEQLKGRFEQNVRVILNKSQLDKWPAFERQLVREKTLHRGRLAGESLNLFHVLRELRLGERTEMAIESVVEQYDLSLHQALQRRNAALLEAQNSMLRSIRNQDQGLSTARTQQEVERRVEVRNVNDQYIEVIASALPSELGEEFRTIALERAYPRVFRPVPATRVFEDAQKIADLDAETIEAIKSLYASMLDELAEVNAKLHRGVRDHEPKAMINQAEIAAARQAGDDVTRLTDPNVVVYRERDERANYYMDRLRELIGYEQFVALPGSSRWVADRRPQTARQPSEQRGEDAAPQRRQRGEDAAPQRRQRGEGTRERPQRGRSGPESASPFSEQRDRN